MINNLVESAVGVSLIRDEIATQSVDAGRSVVWPGRHVTTKLWLVHPADRRDDPLIVALLDVLRDVWGLAPDGPVDKAHAPSEALAGSPR